MKSHREIVQEILATGMSQKQIGEMVGRTQGWVSGIVNGVYQDIGWNEGCALREIHRQRCQQQGQKEAA